MKNDVLSFGEVLVDMVSEQIVECLDDAKSFLKVAGGAPANVAVGTSKLQLNSAFVGRIGNDSMGRFLENTLKEWSVNVEGLQRDEHRHTPLAFVSIDNSGERDFNFYNHDTADKGIVFDPAFERILSKSRIFHFGTFAMSSPMGCEATLEALDFAKQNNILVSCDPNIRTSVWPDLERCKTVVNEAIGFADLLKISDEEVRFLFGTDALGEGISELLDMGPALVVVSTGKDGCIVSTRNHRVKVPCFPQKPVDTTGAGDGFWSGILFALNQKLDGCNDLLSLNERDLYQIGIIGNAVGTIATQGKGAIPCYPSLNELIAFLQSELRLPTNDYLAITFEELDEAYFSDQMLSNQ